MRAAERKYGELAYNSAFGYSVSTGGYFVQAIGGDNVLASSDDEGETWRTRRVTLAARIETLESKPVLVSGWKPWPDVQIGTYLLPPADETPNWQFASSSNLNCQSIEDQRRAFVMNGEQYTNGRELQAPESGGVEGRQETAGEALALSVSGAVGIVEMHNRSRREGKGLDEDANRNLIHSRSVLPSMALTLEAGENVWFVTAVFAVPASVERWHESWRESWEKRPQIPE